MAKKQMTYLTPKEYLNRVIEADCLEIMNQLPDNSIDMVLCDLPYGTTQNKWDSVIPLDTLWKEYKGCSINKNSISICLIQSHFQIMTRIKKAFAKVTMLDIMSVEEELQNDIWIAFNKEVLKAFGIEAYYS